MELEVEDPENLPRYCDEAYTHLRNLVKDVTGEYPGGSAVIWLIRLLDEHFHQRASSIIQFPPVAPPSLSGVGRARIPIDLGGGLETGDRQIDFAPVTV